MTADLIDPAVHRLDVLAHPAGCPSCTHLLAYSTGAPAGVLPPGSASRATTRSSPRPGTRPPRPRTAWPRRDRQTDPRDHRYGLRRTRVPGGGRLTVASYDRPTCRRIV